ncbi:MAG: Hsp33 family molecular chaperone [Alphaproteobacteria bacterium]|nr:Hsp33 family molecular chaperone [Alphaproteobacteria bacterium]
MEREAQDAPAAGDDRVLPFQVAQTAVRGRVVRLGAAIDDILAAHPFAEPVKELLGEATALVALMGAALKFDGRLIFQAQGDGPVSALIADYAADGSLRATATMAGEIKDGARGLRALMGKGHIALTIDQGPDMDRYQGVTSLDADNLAAAAVAYFDQSEQIPTALKLAVGRVSRPGERERWRAGGVIAQFVPSEGGERARGEAALTSEADSETWNRAAAFLETTEADELLDPGVSAETLLYRLYHENGVRVFRPSPLRAECHCNAGKIAAVLARYDEDQLADMVDEGYIRVSCEFCRREYLFDRAGEPAGVR